MDWPEYMKSGKFSDFTFFFKIEDKLFQKYIQGITFNLFKDTVIS